MLTKSGKSLSIRKKMIRSMTMKKIVGYDKGLAVISRIC